MTDTVENPRAVAGDNSGESQAVAPAELRQLIERIERLEEEKAAIAGDIKEVFAEAKGRGFDTKTMRRIIALRKMDSADREQQAAFLGLYAQALGMENVFA